jgi:DNA polymerase III delta subunit
MDEKDVRNSIKNGDIHSQYILLGSEPLIIEKTIQMIEEQLNIDRSFDHDTFSLPETPIDDILSKLYSMAFASPRRFVIARNLEELNQSSLVEFADAINRTGTKNCLVMTYVLSKDDRKIKSTEKKLQELFSNAQCVTYRTDKHQVRNWIAAKVRKDKLPLSTTMMRYLEDQFSNDITGLKNEFDKIENYLAETSSISHEHIQDLAKGLCDYNVYQMIDGFLKGQTQTIVLFNELQPYLRDYTEIVGGLTWGIMNKAQHAYSVLRTAKTLRTILDEVAGLDRSVKIGSQFSTARLELFFLRNAQVFRKGAVYG